MERYSQYMLAHDNATSDRFSIERAEHALEFAQKYNSFDKWAAAPEVWKDQTVILVGDSLTQELFISMACMARQADAIERHSILLKHSSTRDEVLDNAGYSYTSYKMVLGGRVWLKGGGSFAYTDGNIGCTNTSAVDAMPSLITSACDTTQEHASATSPFKIHASYDTGLPDGTISAGRGDVVLLESQGHLMDWDLRGKNVEMLQCIQDKRARNDSSVLEWPHFAYQLSAVPHYWTATGWLNTPFSPNGDRMACRNNNFNNMRKDGMEPFSGIEDIEFIGRRMNMQKLMGRLHVWHGDCVSWIQPGVPDRQVAELADHLLSLFGTGNETRSM